MSLPPFQTLLDLHGTDVHRYLAALVGPQEAGDCFQETWLSALRAYPRLRSGENLKSWLFTIAHRKAIDHFRRTARAPLPTGDAPALDGPSPPGGFAHASASIVQEDDELWVGVRRLPGKQRSAIALRFVLDLGYPEIARSLECSEEAARRSVHEGLKRLRKEYAHDLV